MKNHVKTRFRPVKNIQTVLLVSALGFLSFPSSTSYASSRSVWSVFEQKYALNLHFRNAEVGHILDQISHASKVKIVYSNEQVNVHRKMTVAIQTSDIKEALRKVLGNGYEYKQVDNYISVALKRKKEIEPTEVPLPQLPKQSPKRKLSGVVVDEKGETIIGASVLEKGTANGTITDMNGKFQLQTESNAILEVSYIGYLKQEIATTGKSAFRVVLKEKQVDLGEVVVVGYGTQNKATVTGSISSIDGEKLVQSPVANVSNALVGKVSGLLTMQRQGEPGMDQTTLRIRGVGTFSGSAEPLVMIDGIETMNYNNLDPNEIENITVLKDASATAVYGVRGANGVMLITTKRGNESKPSLSFSSNFGFNSFVDLQKRLGSYEYAKYYNEALKYDSYFTGSYNPKFTYEDIEHFRKGDDPIFHPNVDWFDLVLKPTAMQMHHNLSVRGGTKDIKYFVSAGYFSQDGLFKSFRNVSVYNANIRYRRYDLRANFDVKITKRLSTQIDLASQIENRKGPSSTRGANTQVIMNRFSRAPSYFTPGLVDGKIVNVHNVFLGNPLNELLSPTGGFYRTVSNYITSTVGFNYDLSFLVKGLSAKAKISYWHRMGNRKNYMVTTQTYKAVQLDDGGVFYSPEKAETPTSFGESSSKNRKTYLEYSLNYANQFGGHGVTALLLYNQSKLYDPGLAYVIPNGYQGLVGRVTYNYKKRYLAEFNGGYNGTENFAPGKRFGFFPAYSLGWVVSEEAFFPKNNIMTYFKLRGTYGEVGNDKIGGQRFLYLPSVYEFGGEGYNLGVVGSSFQWYPAAYEGAQGNPNLTWERARKMNVGVDMYLWNDKLKLVFDYFYEKRSNILATPQTVPSIVAASLAPQNWGRMKNAGFEAELNYNDQIGKLRYWVHGTFTFARNKVLFRDEVIKKDALYQMRTGQSSGQMYGFIAEGFYNTWEEVNDVNRPIYTYQNNRVMPGDVKYKDVNGDGKIDAFDQVPVGYPNFPEIMYGLSFGGNYKGFDVSILFQGAERVSRENSETTLRPFNDALMAIGYIPKYSWTQERYEKGENIRLPRLTANSTQESNYLRSTFLIQNAHYLRLKNVEIGYTVSPTWLSRINIKSCRFYVNANNLITWDALFPGDDPEQTSINGETGVYPLTRTFNLGVNLQF